uniref:Uncharacterized protein n=1 Tax=Rhizophora mucronata TaxID=61149 RepID=A0A2P2QPQ3_RHIMU
MHPNILGTRLFVVCRMLRVFHWTLESQDSRRQTIYEMNGCKNCFALKGFRHILFF